MARVPDLTTLIGSEVTRLCIDYNVTLLFATQDQAGEPRIDATMVIATPFTVFTQDSQTTVVPDAGENFAAVLGLLRSTVQAATVAQDQTLTLVFDHSVTLTVPRDLHYESWELMGEGVEGWLVGPP